MGNFIAGGQATVFSDGGGFGVTDVQIDGLMVSGGGVSGTVTVDTTGAGQSFDIESPATAVGFAICSNGIFPPRS